MIARLSHHQLAAMQVIAADSFEKAWSLRELALFLANPNAQCWGEFDDIRSDRPLIGFGIALLVVGDLDIVILATSVNMRRRGTGRRLMEHLLNLPEARRAFLEVDTANEAAFRLYQGLGFSVLKKRAHYYDGKRDAWLMKWTCESMRGSRARSSYCVERTEASESNNTCTASGS